MEQGTKEWLELRRTKIGASDSPVIMDVSPWKTPFQLWEEKVFGKEQEITGAMARGSALEESARERFQEKMGIMMLPKVVLHHERKWQMASLDGITFDGTSILEIKHANKEVHEMAIQGNLPIYYMIQIQHALDTTGAAKCYYVVSNGEKDVYVEVFPDEELIKEIRVKNEKFYEYITSKEAPPLTDRDYIDQHKNKTWQFHAERWVNAHYALKRAELDEEVARKTMLELSQGKNCKCDKMKVTRSVCKGTVDYKAVPELIGINLDPYRKPPCEKWRLSVNTKEET